MSDRFTAGHAGKYCLAIWAALTLTAVCGPSLSVTNLKGVSIAIELVSLEGDTVKFRRAGNPKDFAMPINQFDEASQKEIRAKAAALPAEKPKIKMDIVIGKRRTDQNDSYYMVKQEITSTIKLTNLSTTISVPKVTGTIVFIGQSTSLKDVYNVTFGLAEGLRGYQEQILAGIPADGTLGLGASALTPSGVPPFLRHISSALENPVLGIWVEKQP